MRAVLRELLPSVGTSSTLVLLHVHVSSRFCSLEAVVAASYKCKSGVFHSWSGSRAIASAFAVGAGHVQQSSRSLA